MKRMNVCVAELEIVFKIQMVCFLWTFCFIYLISIHTLCIATMDHFSLILILLLMHISRVRGVRSRWPEWCVPYLEYKFSAYLSWTLLASTGTIGQGIEYRILCACAFTGTTENCANLAQPPAVRLIRFLRQVMTSRCDVLGVASIPRVPSR